MDKANTSSKRPPRNDFYFLDKSTVLTSIFSLTSITTMATMRTTQHHRYVQQQQQQQFLCYVYAAPMQIPADWYTRNCVCVITTNLSIKNYAEIPDIIPQQVNDNEHNLKQTNRQTDRHTEKQTVPVLFKTSEWYYLTNWRSRRSTTRKQVTICTCVEIHDMTSFTASTGTTETELRPHYEFQSTKNGLTTKYNTRSISSGVVKRGRGGVATP